MLIELLGDYEDLRFEREGARRDRGERWPVTAPGSAEVFDSARGRDRAVGYVTFRGDDMTSVPAGTALYPKDLCRPASAA
jgi:hypothetical protein